MVNVLTKLEKRGNDQSSRRTRNSKFQNLYGVQGCFHD